MAVFTFEGVAAPVVVYNFKESVREIKEKFPERARELIPAFAGGFFATPLTEEMLYNPDAKFTGEEKDYLKDHLGGHVIWMEEESPSIFPREELLAILLHEQGHIENGDLPHDSGIRGVIVDNKKEIAADAYAAKRCGKKKMAKALRRAFYTIGLRASGDKKKAAEIAKEIMANDDIQLRLIALS